MRNYMQLLAAYCGSIHLYRTEFSIVIYALTDTLNRNSQKLTNYEEDFKEMIFQFSSII